MGAYSGNGARLPAMASIPDPQRVEGVRAYREPDEPLPLQITFLDADGELAWVEEMRGLLCAGRAAEADARLAADLAGFDGSLARLCRATSVDDVLLEGWEDLLPILAEWEGPPVTAITLGLTNPPDLVFEAGQTHEPDLMLGLYSDDTFPFSRAGKADLLAECGKELPGWIDAEEDVEFYCTLSGLASLNTALINCKHRYFLRDGRDGPEGRAPGGYVEFVLASWLLATRFLQAAERIAAGDYLPKGCRLIAGTVGTEAEFAAVLGPEAPAAAASARGAASGEAGFATLTIKPWVPREDPTADKPASRPTLRQRIQEVEAEPERRSWLSRLFGSRDWSPPAAPSCAHAEPVEASAQRPPRRGGR